jgi:hypothetical protein
MSHTGELNKMTGGLEDVAEEAEPELGEEQVSEFSIKIRSTKAHL